MRDALDGTNKEQEFRIIYEAYVDAIYRLCFSYMKNHMDAEDVVQEIFMKYYRLDKKINSDSGIKAWLIVTASNGCKDLLKHWWRKRKNITDYEEILSDGTNQVDEMMELVMKLPDKYKTVVYLYYYENYVSKEIAEILHKPDSTIRTYLQKARKLLQKEME